MTIEEKLQHFKEACTADAIAAAEKILSDYKNALEKDFLDYQNSETRLADMEVKTETTRIDKEMNKELALEQIKLRMELGKKAAELKEKIFAQLEERLAEYQETPEYVALIPEKNMLIDNSFEKKISEAKEKFDVDMEVL